MIENSSEILSAQNAPEALFELGQLYADRCDMLVAIEKFEEASDKFYADKNYARFIDCQHRLLRLYAETKNQDKIIQTKEMLQDLVIKEGLELNSRTYYTLGVCASHKGQYEVALEYFQKSLAMALAEDDKANLCYAINGLAITYYNLKKYQDALKEIYNLKVFFQVLPIEDVRISASILNANILRRLKRYDEALEILWECYGHLRQSKNLYMYIFILCTMGTTYLDSGDKELARVYLDLAKRSVDPENLKWLAGEIDARIAELGDSKDRLSQYDLVFDEASNSVTEKKKGRVDFKNQFILLDMLRLFMTNPGQIYSKESLVEEVWRQEYDPAVHDNKIYVTIKRLRKLIEPDFDKPRYIFRAKNGYYLNKSTQIFVEPEIDKSPLEGKSYEESAHS